METSGYYSLYALSTSKYSGVVSILIKFIITRLVKKFTMEPDCSLPPRLLKSVLILVVRPCILIVVYVFLDAATLTEVFPCFFLGCKANARV
jgi:hypothetical protein